MNDRDELGELPSIAPARDDIATRRPTSRRAEPPRGGVPPLFSLLLAVLVLGLSVSGYFLASQQQALAEAQAARAQAEARLARIEDQLSLTGQALSETENETQSQINFWESEIRKLWDVTNKRNRAWIEENQAAVKRRTNDLESQGSTVKSVAAQASDLKRALAAQAELVSDVKALKTRSNELLARQRSITDQLNATTQTAKALEATLAQRVKDNEEAITAIDGSRRDMVRRLTTLSDRLTALEGGAPAAQTLTPISGP